MNTKNLCVRTCDWKRCREDCGLPRGHFLDKSGTIVACSNPAYTCRCKKHQATVDKRRMAKRHQPAFDGAEWATSKCSVPPDAPETAEDMRGVSAFGRNAPVRDLTNEDVQTMMNTKAPNHLEDPGPPERWPSSTFKDASANPSLIEDLWNYVQDMQQLFEKHGIGHRDPLIQENYNQESKTFDIPGLNVDFEIKKNVKTKRCLGYCTRKRCFSPCYYLEGHSEDKPHRCKKHWREVVNKRHSRS